MRSEGSWALLMQAPAGASRDSGFEQMMDMLPLAAAGLRLGGSRSRRRKTGEVVTVLIQVGDDGDSSQEGGRRGWVLNIFSRQSPWCGVKRS